MFKALSLRITIICIYLLPMVVFCQESDARRVGGDFELTSQFDQPYSSVDARGKVIMLFFGFTHCPDVCPNTLSTVQTVLGQLGERAIHVQPIFVSVDPQRDKPEVLKNYLQYFGNNFIGLTGTSKEIDKVVKQFQGFYSFDGNIETNHYTVDHTSNLYILDTTGEVTNIIPYGLPPQAIIKAIEKLI